MLVDNLTRGVINSGFFIHYTVGTNSGVPGSAATATTFSRSLYTWISKH
jgi:hypothetical protein